MLSKNLFALVNVHTIENSFGYGRTGNRLGGVAPEGN